MRKLRTLMGNVWRSSPAIRLAAVIICGAVFLAVLMLYPDLVVRLPAGW